MTSLIDKMTWEEICNLYSDDYLKGKKKKRYTKEQYIEWMLKQKDISPSGYKGGMFFNKSMYHYCFNVYMKLRHTKQHHVTLIVGETGKGKSRLGLKIAALTDPDIILQRIITVPLELIPVLLNSKRGNAIQVDEGINVLCSSDAITTLGKAMNKITDLIRNYGYHWIICIPSIHDLPKRIREEKKFISAIIVKEENLKAKTDNERYRPYKFYGKSTIGKIQELLKIGKNPFKAKIKNLKGANTIEIPNINDITDELYELKKKGDADIVLKNIQTELENKFGYAKVMDNINEPIVENINMNITLNDAAKILKVNPDTVRDRIIKGDLIGEKVYGKWQVKKDSVITYLDNKNKVIEAPKHIEVPKPIEVAIPKEDTSLKFVSVKEASRILMVNKNTLDRYMKEGKVKANRVGGKWLIREDHLKELTAL